MAFLSITGIEKTIDSLRAAVAGQELKVTKAYQNLVYHVYKDIVYKTPQWSGQLASNWQVQIGLKSEGFVYPMRPHPDYGKDPLYSDFEPKNAIVNGGFIDPAVMVAMREAAVNVKRIRWNSKVAIVNPVPYAVDVEHGIAPHMTQFRPENIYAGGTAMIQYAVMKYSNQSEFNRAALDSSR